MNDIQHKFYDNSITVDELDDLQQAVKNMTDKDLEADMYARWSRWERLDDEAFQPYSDRIWGQIRQRVQPRRQRSKRFWWNALKLAAVVLPPLLLAGYMTYQHRFNTSAVPETVVSTGNDERATIHLPDGSRVMMNERSTIRYDLASFNQSKRQLKFDGEGFFEIHPDSKHPFLIQSNKLNVQVLGTRFNFYSRRDESRAELVLASGKVLLTAISSGKSVTMKPNQWAVVDKRTGHISVTTLATAVNDATAWCRRELTFRNAPLWMVLSTLEKTYHVRIHTAPSINTEDLFTGTMTSNNINENLEILETSYHFHTRINDNVVEISR